jgi:hypothetical protein
MAVQDKNFRAGWIHIESDGVALEAKGDFTINPGEMVRETLIGTEKALGYKGTPQAAFIEGAIIDSYDLDTIALRNTKNATITCKQANGKTWIFYDCWYSGEGSMTTGEAEIPVRFESVHQGVEIK